MLVTVITDIYSKQEAGDVSDAIDDIASPKDDYGFSSTGIYMLFNPESSGILYIGLARDLPVRFGHHNGLIPFSAKGCKRKEIDRWFEENEKIGYSMVVQSCFEQHATERNMRAVELHNEESPIFFSYPTEGLEQAKIFEGLLIEAHRKKHGTKPPWNKVGGSVEGQRVVTEDAFSFVEMMAGKRDGLFKARRTIRELSADPTSMFLRRHCMSHASKRCSKRTGKE
jgi:hypothetical protein